MAAHGDITVTSTLRTPWKTDKIKTIARHILGPRYSLSIVLVGEKRARTLNKRYRGKDYVPNVLTFPIDAHSAEIFLTIPKIKREARRYGLSPHGHMLFLLIHGCLHLKGYAHGSTMERAEQKLLSAFNIR